MKLTDRYTLHKGVAYLTGIQALVRLPLDQMRLDRDAGLRTAAFISGYEGSPLGGYDLALQRVRPLLDEHGVRFVPAVNEDLAATSIFGSQIYQVLGPGTVDGVVGIWYGKGPGVDRSCDVFRHANLAGSPGNCAALVLAGDDHPCKSSSIPHQSDFSLYSVGIPILFPGNTQEVLDYGLYAIALSRYSGAWASMKLLVDVCDGGGTVNVSLDRHHFVSPAGYEKRTEPRLSPPFTVKLETETNQRRLAAAIEFARANPINRWFGARDRARLGLATAGKYYYDLMQALADLGIGERDLEPLGIRVAKFGMTFPIEPRFAAEFASGLDTIIVVEEKRSFLELHLKEALYNLDAHPRILGKLDADGQLLFPPYYELDPDRIARILGPHLIPLGVGERTAARLRQLDAAAERPRDTSVARTPNYCSGCPHNRGTLLLEGQAAGGGIGCHGMGIMMEGAGRGYLFATQMGGEGAPWIGMSPFTERKHIFQNIGDGTLFHSGYLAIEAAVAAGVNITYRILYNGAVAMTGGQQATGALPIPALTRKLEAEGVSKIVIATEDVARYDDPGKLAMNATVRDRGEIEAILSELEQTRGVSVLIYDQECAAEKRRKRSRGIYAEPVERLVIHEEVCEGCGDCITQSNCMSLTPVATEFGDKIRIHQSSCNKDYTCALGDCPSFVRIQIRQGTGLRRPLLPTLQLADVPEPSDRVRAGDGYRILCPGIGGTGVVTINALLATAATIDGLSVITLDQTGLAQKGGAVVSHILLSEQPVEAPARANTAAADLVLGFDLITVTHPDNFKCLDSSRTAAVLNTALTPTGQSIRKLRLLSDGEQRLSCIAACTTRNVHLDATRLAESLFGTHMLANMILLGAAWQSGLVPLTLEALEESIRLNGVEVDRNLQAFRLGRQYHQDAAAVEKLAAPAPPPPVDDPIALRVTRLRGYQNDAYARRYSDAVERVRAVQPALTEVVARNLYKLMAYKDEYEVARLLTRPSFTASLVEQWESMDEVRFLLHPPLLRRLGLKRKIALPAWPLHLLAAMKVLRGTPFDVFGWTAHRRRERELVTWYLSLVEEALLRTTPDSMPQTVELLSLPDQIRGYEAIKEQRIAAAKQRAAEILRSYSTTPHPATIS